MDLNEQQRLAVEHREGPLLIVAGAGTGKTRVIVERVGYLLGHVPGLEPENILALTFGNKAAQEMKQRAAQRFGAATLRCRFSTFHSFCYELLSQDSPRRALDQIDQWIFLRRQVEQLELDHYLRVSEPGRFLEDLVAFCSRCHDNLVSPSDYCAYIEKLAADCRQAAGKGPRPKHCTEEEIARQREVARVYERSEALQAEKGLLSFGAMISRAVTLLDASPDFLHYLQHRYQFILVDEFQDTNTAQFELLARLAGEKKNLTAVGDDDQAIYRFRGASYASFEQFRERFPGHRQVVLDRNYRSTQRILAVAGAAISFNAQDRYRPDKKLVTANPAGPKVEVREFADEIQQAESVAAEIASQVQSGKARGYSDFAVLYRAHRHRDWLVSTLQRSNIPFAIRNLAVNRLPPVRDLVAYLRAIGHPADNVSLIRALANPRWEMEANELLEYCRQATDRRCLLREVLEDPNLPNTSAGRTRLLVLLNRYQKISQEQRLHVWLDRLTCELDLPGLPEYEPALKAFSEFVSRWDREKSATGMLAEFLEYFGYFEEAKGTIVLPEEEEAEGAASWTGESAGLGGQAENPSLPQQGSLCEAWVSDDRRGKVQLMTVHAAKGLEFENVFVLHMVRGAFPTRHQRPLISLPAALWKGPLPQGDFHIEEERRLFYVALTRARSSLTLCAVSNDRQRPSVFLEQLIESDGPDLEWKKLPTRSAEPEMNLFRRGISSGPPRFSQIVDWAAASPAIPAAKDFSLSVSGLQTYLECPLKYQYGYVWRVPLAPAPAMLFGSILHGAVKEVVQILTQRRGHLTPEDFARILRERWPPSGFADPVQEHKYWDLGCRQLEGLWQQLSSQPFQLLYQEKTFQLQQGRTRIVGRIDQINRIAGEEVELIEYKTGRPQTQKEADQSLQLTLYAHACRQALGLKPVRLVLYNLATQEAVRTERGPEDFRHLQETIRQESGQILAGEFPIRPGYHCRYCEFQLICPAHEDFSQEGKRSA